MPEVPALSQDAARQRRTPEEVRAEINEAVTQAAEGPQVVEARTAIVIFQTPDGQTVLATDINLPLSIERMATPDEAYGMLATSLKDIHVQEAAALSAQQTVQASIAHAQRMQQAMQEQAIKQALEKQGGMRQPEGRG